MTHPFDELGADLSGHQLSRVDSAETHEHLPEHESLATPEARRYRPGLLLGVGGMGQVVAATDERLGRQVALKRPRPGLPPALEARLAREAHITAGLDHPGVVPVYDAGIGPDGRLYYTMPIVRGQSLADLLRGAERASPRLLRRVLEACEAVGAAHRQGIVHRDLKPANLMIGDGAGTRVLDWGLARLMSDAPSGEVVGTPRYMSPEQARGEVCDPRSDVWSLGAILHEVATLSAVRPEDPSEALAQARRNEEPAVARSVEGLPRELVAIIERALAHDPAARYPDGSALARDLGNLLDGRRVLAHDYSARELLGRFVRTWRVPLAVAGVALVVVIVLLALGMDRLSTEATRAELAADASEVAAREARDARDDARRDLGQSLASQARLGRDKGSRAVAELLAAHALTHVESPAARGVVATWSVAPAPELVSSIALPSCLGRHIDRAGMTLACREPDALSVWDLGPDGPRLRWRRMQTFSAVAVDAGLVATLYQAREIDVFDADTGRLVDTFTSSCSRDISIFETTTSTTARAAAGPQRTGTERASDTANVLTWGTGCMQVNELARNTEHRTYACEGHGIIGAFAIDRASGGWSALCEDGLLVSGTFLAEGTHEVRTQLKGPRIALALVHLDGGRIAAGTADGWLVVLDASGQELVKMPSGSAKVVGLRVSDDRQTVAAIAADGTTTLIEAGSGLATLRLDESTRQLGWWGDELWLAGRELRRYRLRPGPPAAFEVGSGVTSLAFSPDGTGLSATSGYGVVTRSLSDGALLGRVAPEVDFIKSGAYTPDGLAFLTASSQRGPTPNWAVESWETDTWQALPPTPLPWHARRIAALAGGTALTIPYYGGLLVFHPFDGEQRMWLVEGLERFADLASSTNHRFAVVLSEDTGRILRIRADDLSVETLGHEPRARAVAIGNDGAMVVGAGDNGLWFFDAEGPRLVDTLELDDVTFDDVALSPDMRWVAAGSRDGVAWVWRTADKRLVATFDDHDERVNAVAFSNDATMLATGSWDGWVRLFDLRRLDTPAADLVRELETTWRLSLATVLSGAR